MLFGCLFMVVKRCLREVFRRLGVSGLLVYRFGCADLAYPLIVLVICFFVLYWLLLVVGLFVPLCWFLQFGVCG